MTTPTDTAANPSAELDPKLKHQLCSFTDHKGKRWILELTVGLVRRIKQALGVDLLDLQGNGLTRLYANPMDLADTLFLICEDQAKAAGIDDQAFGERLAGDTIDQAAAALCNALVFFSPKHQRRAMLVALEKVEQLREKTAAACVAWLQSESATAELESQLTRIPGDLSETLRASLK